MTTGINQQSLEDHGALIFDIDRIRECAVGAEGSAVLSVADELHEGTWEVFREALTDEYEVVLQSVGEKMG